MNSLLLLARRTATSSLGKRILSQRVQLANQELTRRFLASEASKQNTQATSGSETDKPQWERSYKYRIFYGVDAKDEVKDKAYAHFYTFMILLALVYVPFTLLYYYPDWKLSDWAYREAHLELARREKAGLPLVDPNYIPVDRIKLPSEEELGDTKIII